MTGWRYATLTIEQEAHDVTWIVTAVDCAEDDALDETLVGTKLYRADLLNIAGAHGWEAYSVVRSIEGITGTEVETFYFKRPGPADQIG